MAVLRKALLAGLLVSIGAAGALGVHAQLEDPPADRSQDTDRPPLDRAEELSSTTSCDGLELVLPVYEQTGPAEFARLARERMDELGC